MVVTNLQFFFFFSFLMATSLAYRNFPGRDWIHASNSDQSHCSQILNLLRHTGNYNLQLLFFFFFLGSQARGQIRAKAASLRMP